MSKKISYPHIVDSHVVDYNDREGNPQSKTFESVHRGTATVYPGGSAFLGFVVLCLAFAPGVVLVISSAVARIRVDGKFVLEPDSEVRVDDWFPKGSKTAVKGGYAWDLAGDTSREYFANLAMERFPSLKKNERIARAELAKRAA